MKYLLEQWLSSEFTIGFELEGYCRDDRQEILDTAREFFPSGISIYGNETIKDDGSLDSGNYDSHPTSFEYTSKIFKLNMGNLQRIINFLDYLNKNDLAITDSTCGFHVHIGFPDKFMQSSQQFWVLLNLIFEPEAKQLANILSQGDINFYTDDDGGEGYASFAFILKLKAKLEKYLFQSLLTKESVSKREIIDSFKTIYSSEKYRFLRIHPQGTLEWRGPRGFLDSGKRSEIKTFFLQKLFPFVYWITKTLDNETLTIQGYKINRDEVISTMYKINSISSPTKRNNTYFHSVMNRINIRTFLQKFPQYSPNKKLKYSNMLAIIDKKGVPIFAGGEFSGGQISDAIIYGGSYSNVEFNNCQFISNFGKLPALFENDIDIIQSSYSGGINSHECKIINCKYDPSSEIKIYDGIINNLNSISNNGRYVSSSNVSFSSCAIDNSDLIFVYFSNNNKINTSTIRKAHSSSHMEYYNCNIFEMTILRKNIFNQCNIYKSYLDKSNEMSIYADCIIEGNGNTGFAINKGKFIKCEITDYRILNSALVDSKYKFDEFNYESAKDRIEEYYRNVIWINSKFYIKGEVQEFLPNGIREEDNVEKANVKIFTLREILKDKILFAKRIVAGFKIDPYTLKWETRDRDSQCPTCDGVGVILNNVLCPTCLGTGLFSNYFNYEVVSKDEYEEYKDFKDDEIQILINSDNYPYALLDKDEFEQNMSDGDDRIVHQSYTKLSEELEELEGLLKK